MSSIQADSNARKKSTIKRITFTLVGAVVVALVALGVANLLGFSPFQAGKNDRDRPALLKSIQDVSQYHAAVGNFEVVIDDKTDDSWVPPIIAGRRTLFVAAGTVNAYIDLSGLAEKDLNLSADGKSLTVRLPEAQLDKPNLDLERSYTYSQDRGVLDRISDAVGMPEQEKKMQILAEKKFTAAAEQSELRKRATENTKSMLTGMFGSIGIKVSFLDK
ncbi:DUF4230 domain-containing protein [Pseudarthrobacter sp. B907]|uniref:DUF4230 domain-containing protein n=1 Tax=Pseudarthrobacter sp. B907 TaxID=3158261 RepID=UPI0032DA1714